LLLKSLGSEGYAKINDRISILARSRLRDGKSYHKDLYNPYCTFGNQKKDLDDVYPNSPKGQRILIDDDSSFAAPHQIKNPLNVSGFNWQEELLNYESYGFGLYYCTSQAELEKFQSETKPGESIILFAKEDQNFVIIYQDKEGKKEFELSPEESIQINKLHNQSISENSTFISIKYPHKDSEYKIIDIIKQLYLSDILSKGSCGLIDRMGG